jgi:hypothetical protein
MSAAVAPAQEPTSVQPQISVQPKISVQPQMVTTVTEVAVKEPEASGDPLIILGHVLTALENMPGGDNLAATLAEGTVTIQGNELIVTLAKPASVIPFLISADQKQAANAAATAAAGRPLKLTLVGGAQPHAHGNPPPTIARPRNGASARSRAAEDPIVQRMREKFGAEIRTVIDHRDKN